jgi:DNA damage-binding protein 1
MWSLRQTDDSIFDKYLVQSFTQETRILVIEEEEMSEGFITGFISSEPTLFCGNLRGDRFVQVTPSAVVVVQQQTGGVIFTYNSPHRIIVADGNSVQVVIATASSELLYFELDDSSVISLVSRVVLDNDVACLSLRPPPVHIEDLSSKPVVPPEAMSTETDPPAVPPAFPSVGSSSPSYRVVADKNLLSPGGRSNLLAVGMWTDGSVRLMALPTLSEVCRAQLGADVQIRDIMLFHHVEENTNREIGDVSVTLCSYLLAGMGDGCMICYSIEAPNRERVLTVDQFRSEMAGSQTYLLGSRRRVVLGTRPVSFTCFVSSGKICTFATSDRPTVVYVRNSQLLFSMVNSAEVTSVCSFNNSLFPESLAMSLDKTFMVCDLDTIQKVHVEKVEIGADPLKICFSSVHGVYAGEF